MKNFTWNDVVMMAARTANKEDPLQAEFLLLVEKARKIYAKKKKIW
jgi:hypothetical protein